MDKPIEFLSLYDLISNFKEAYNSCGHTVLKVRVGELVSHDQYSVSPVSWRGLTLRPEEDDEAEARREAEKFSAQLKSFLRYEKSV